MTSLFIHTSVFTLIYVSNMNLLFFFIFFYIKQGITNEDIRDYDLNQLEKLLTELAFTRSTDVGSEDVKFYLNTREVSNQQIPLASGDIDPSKNTKMVIHGWIDNHNRSWYNHLTSEYLKKENLNIIQVDWWSSAHSFYLSSARSTRQVGNLVAEFILNHNLLPKRIHLIGHSLGAHVAAFAAKQIKHKTGNRIARITGLDPAGPNFNLMLNDERLNARDADVVDVFHTDGGFFGYYRPMGTFDVYINGGTRIQPDCRMNLRNISTVGALFEDMYCSHTRSYVRFTEIINDIKFSCKKCESWIKYMLNQCNVNDSYVFGAEDINKTMNGVCFVNTENK